MRPRPAPAAGSRKRAIPYGRRSPGTPGPARPAAGGVRPAGRAAPRRVVRSWTRRARASSSTSAAMRSMTAATRARPAATMARSGQPADGAGWPPAGSCQRPGARASLRTVAASSPHRIAGRRWCPGRRVRCPPRNRDLPGLASPLPAARRAPRPAHPGRRRPRAGAPARVTARSPRPGCGSRSPRRGPRPAPTSVPVRPASPPGPGDPGQDPPLPPARLDPLADRHPPIVPAAFRKLDATAVLTGPLLPAPRGDRRHAHGGTALS